MQVPDSLGKRASCVLACPGLQLAQAKIVPEPIVRGGAGPGEGGTRCLVLSYLAAQLAEQHVECGPRWVRVRALLEKASQVAQSFAKLPLQITHFA